MTIDVENRVTQDHTDLAELWTDFVDWTGRLEKEGPFLLQHLHRRHDIFDACLGDGVDSVYLLQHGFSVVSNERDLAFQKKAIENGIKCGVHLHIVAYDWRNLHQYHPKCQFDAILCLGNSLTYLFNAKERESVIKNFLNLLKPGGMLIVDARNYSYILKNKEQIMQGTAPVTHQKTVYCGKNVIARPVIIENSLVVMQYHHKETNLGGYLSFYPFKEGELPALLQRHFTSVKTYSDFQEGDDVNAGFFQYVCVK